MVSWKSSRKKIICKKAPQEHIDVYWDKASDDAKDNSIKELLEMIRIARNEVKENND